MGKGWTVCPELLQILAQQEQGLGHSLILFAGLLDLTLSHEVLKLLVSAQSQHFLPATGIPSPESRMNNGEKGFEFIGLRSRKGHHEFLSDIVWAAAGEGAES